MSTKLGFVKKTPIADYSNIRKTGIVALRLRPDDRLPWVKTTTGQQNIILISQKGQAIYFQETDARPMGRSASGVRGIRLRSGDQVIDSAVIQNPESELLTILENGFGKRTNIARHFHLQKRGGVGARAARVNQKTGPIVSALVLEDTASNLIISSIQGQVIRIKTGAVKRLGRDTQGVRVMRLNARDKVASVTLVANQDDQPPQIANQPLSEPPIAPEQKPKEEKPIVKKNEIKPKEDNINHIKREKTAPSAPAKPTSQLVVKPTLDLKESPKQDKLQEIEKLAGLAWEGKVKRINTGLSSKPVQPKPKPPAPQPRDEFKKRRFE